MVVPTRRPGGGPARVVTMRPGFMGVCVDLCGLACGTSFDVLGDEILHAGPPVYRSFESQDVP